MTETIAFEVRGLPAPQGSTRAFTPKGWSHPVITSSSKGLAVWRRLIADVAQEHAPTSPWEGPVSVLLAFRLPKPKSAPKRKPTWPDKRPDLDKLVRSVFDAITYVLIADDSQVVSLYATKEYGPPGVRIEVRRVLAAERQA